MSTKFIGSPCKKCGGTERWTCNKSCVQCDRAQSRKRYAEGHRKKHNKNRHREWYLRRNYGISHEDYEKMFAAQDGVCAICRRPPPARKKLAVDHNHNTRAVRALLCDHCNTAIGHLDEDIARLLAAVAYLERYNGHEAPSDQAAPQG